MSDINQWNETAKENYESFKALIELNQKLLERGITFQREVLESMMTKANAQAEKAGKASDFQSLVEIQAEATRENTEEVVAQTRKAYELLEQARADFTAWVDQSTKQAAKATKVA